MPIAGLRPLRLAKVIGSIFASLFRQGASPNQLASVERLADKMVNQLCLSRRGLRRLAYRAGQRHRLGIWIGDQVHMAIKRDRESRQETQRCQEEIQDRARIKRLLKQVKGQE